MHGDPSDGRDDSVTNVLIAIMPAEFEDVDCRHCNRRFPTMVDEKLTAEGHTSDTNLTQLHDDIKYF